MLSFNNVVSSVEAQIREPSPKSPSQLQAEEQQQEQKQQTQRELPPKSTSQLQAEEQQQDEQLSPLKTKPKKVTPGSCKKQGETYCPAGVGFPASLTPYCSTLEEHDNCGACGVACDDTQETCDATTSPAKCVRLCPSPEAPTKTTLCPTTDLECHDLTSENDNCGACGNECNTATGERCVNSQCYDPCPGANSHEVIVADPQCGTPGTSYGYCMAYAGCVAKWDPRGACYICGCGGLNCL